MEFTAYPSNINCIFITFSTAQLWSMRRCNRSNTRSRSLYILSYSAYPTSLPFRSSCIDLSIIWQRSSHNTAPDCSRKVVHASTSTSCNRRTIFFDATIVKDTFGMSKSQTPRILLLSQSPSTSTVDVSALHSSSGSSSSPPDKRKRSLSRSRQRKASLASSKGSFDSSMSTSISAVPKSSMNGADGGKAILNGSYGSDKDYAGGYSSNRTSRRTDLDDGEEDDLIAIPGEETLLHENVSERTYSQMNARPNHGAIRSRADLMRKMSIVLALIGSWCE